MKFVPKHTLIRSGSIDLHMSGRNIVATQLKFTTPPPPAQYTHCTLTTPVSFEMIGSVTAARHRRHGAYDHEWVENWGSRGQVRLRSGSVYEATVELFFPGNEYVNYHGYKPPPSINIFIPGVDCRYNAALRQA